MRNIDTAVIHHTATKRDTTTFEAIRRYHMTTMRWRDIGYHFLILHNGEVRVGRALNSVGAHCAGHNAHSIGVCLAGDFTKELPTASQLESLRELLVSLQRDYPGLVIKGHQEMSGTATACPGKNLLQVLRDWRAVGII